MENILITKKKILITGSHGLLGSSLVNYLSKKYQVIAFHRDKKILVNSFKNYRVNLINFKLFKKKFNEIKPDIVIHTAAYINIDYCEKNKKKTKELNYFFVKNLSNLCKNKTKLIFISTDQIYGQSKLKNEKSHYFNPVNYYGRNKLDSEKYIIKNNTNYINIRTNFYGINIKKNKISFVEWILDALKNNKKISLFNDYYFNPISSIELSNNISKLINKNFIGTINLGSKDYCSKYEFGYYLSKKFKYNSSNILSISMDEHLFKAKRSKNLVMELDKAYKLKLKVPTYKQSINNFLIFYKKNKIKK